MVLSRAHFQLQIPREMGAPMSINTGVVARQSRLSCHVTPVAPWADAIPWGPR